MKMYRNKRVLVCEFYQESNTFNPITTGYESFGAYKNIEGMEEHTGGHVPI